MGQVAVSDAPAEAFVIEGGRALSGHVKAAGNKNGALPILAACVLTREPVTLENVPRIRDVETMVELIGTLGVEDQWTGQNSIRVQASEVESVELDDTLAKRIRTSLLLAGPLLARERRTDRPAARRRRDRPPADRHPYPRARRARRRDHHRAAVRDADRGAPRPLDPPGRGERHGDGERRDGGGDGARPNRALQRRVRAACRISVGSSDGSARGSTASVRTGCTSRASSACRAARGGSLPTTSRSRASSAWPRRPAATSRSTRPGPRISCRSCPPSRKLGIEVETSGTSVHVPDGRQLSWRTIGSQIEIEDGPWPCSRPI